MGRVGGIKRARPVTTRGCTHADGRRETATMTRETDTIGNSAFTGIRTSIVVAVAVVVAVVLFTRRTSDGDDGAGGGGGGGSGGDGLRTLSRRYQRIISEPLRRHVVDQNIFPL